MLKREEIEKIIPQREPFLMIDEVESYIPGEKCTAYKDVKKEEWYFRGHFPGNPIMPGVLITESFPLSRCGCNIIFRRKQRKECFIWWIDKMKFKKMVVPGDRLKLEVNIIKKKGPIGVGEAIATVDGKVVAKGELTFAVV